MLYLIKKVDLMAFRDVGNIKQGQNHSISRFLTVFHHFKQKTRKKIFDPKIDKGPPYVLFKTHILDNISRTVSQITKISKDLNSARQITLYRYLT